MFGWRSKNASVAVRSPKPLLNLGCGDRLHDDWTNVDIAPRDPRVVAHDLRRPLPFPADTFQAVYHSHVLEHIPRDHSLRFLQECHRVLRAGGVIRVVVPDLETIARLYLQNLDAAAGGDPDAVQRYEWIVLELLDQLVRNRSGGRMMEYWRQEPMPAAEFVYSRMGSEVKRWREALLQGEAAASTGAARPPTDAELGRFRQSGEVHQWMYDRHSLGRLLAEAGFEKVKVCGATESAIPDFASYGLDAEPDGAVRKPDSLFVEGFKPAVAQ